MTIGKVMESTGLTRKAVRYYESAGLVEPEIMENGYRNYSQQAVKQLILIKTLRELSFSIDEIRKCLRGKTELKLCLEKKHNQIQKQQIDIASHLDLLTSLLSENDTSLDDIRRLFIQAEQLIRKREQHLNQQLHRLFPGSFGTMLTAAYGHLLDESLTTPEQHQAWEALIRELDELPSISVPRHIEDWARKQNKKSLREGFDRLTEEYAQDYEEFSRKKRAAIETNIQNKEEGEIQEQTNHAQDFARFLAAEGKGVSRVFGKYLPILSRQFQRFALMQSRFLKENPDILTKISENF